MRNGRKEGRVSLRDCSEHQLVHAVYQCRHSCASHTWLAQHALQSEMIQVTDVGTRVLGEGEGETPEEPLEGDDSDSHHRKIYHRQGILASQKTGIEEPNARYHEPYQSVTDEQTR
jgi:hypothetical protein